MESNKIAIAAILFILLVVAINFAMYGIARGAAKGGDSRWMSALARLVEQTTGGLVAKIHERIAQASRRTGK